MTPPRECKHFLMHYPNGDRVLICPCCTKFWELQRRKKPFNEVFRDWIDAVGSRLFIALMIGLVLSTLTLAVSSWFGGAL